MEEAASQRVAAATKNVPVYWHTITSGGAGNIASSTISRQIQVLNEDFAPSGFAFKLVETDVTNNANWYTRAELGSSVESQMKNALRKGGANALVS